MEMIRSFNGAPTPISWGELYTALQQGVVDGAENNPPSFYLSRHYEVCKYYTINEHTMLPDVLVVSTHLWKSHSSEEQKWLQEAANNTVEHQRQLWHSSEEEALSELQKEGVQIIYPDKEPFKKAVQPIYDAYKKDEVINELITKIQQIQ